VSEERKRVLQMLAEGKLEVAEAERLLAALAGSDEAEPVEAEVVDDTAARPVPKFLRVECLDGASKVDVRVPIQLLRSGMKLGSLLPEEARGKVDAALGEKGINFDLKNMRGDELDDFLRLLWDLKVDIEDGSDKVRVFVE
jgi:hypothetical protein